MKTDIASLGFRSPAVFCKNAEWVLAAASAVYKVEVEAGLTGRVPQCLGAGGGGGRPRAPTPFRKDTAPWAPAQLHPWRPAPRLRPLHPVCMCV